MKNELGTQSSEKDQEVILKYLKVRNVSIPKLLKYSGISLVRSTRDQDFLYGLNVVRTKKCDCVRIFSLLYAEIDIACLTVPSIWGVVP